MHLFAWWIVGGYADANVAYDTATLVGVTGTLLAVVVAAAVAGDGVGDARLLCALRPRSHPHLAGVGAQSLRRAHGAHRGRLGRWSRCCWRRRSSTCWRCAAALRWLAAYGVVAAMGAVATAAARRADHRAVPPDRRQAHAADRADRGGGDRRRLRHRPADRRHLLVRHAVALRRAAIANGCWRARPIRRAPCGGRRAPCWAISARSPASSASALPCSARRSRCSRAASASTRWPRPASRSAWCASAAPRLPSVARSPGARAAAQGMDAAQARSLADVADADADPLSAAAGAVAVAHFPRRHRRLRRAGAGDGDGGRPTRRRPRLAADLGRGRARPGGHRADHGASACCAPRSRR